MYKMKFGLFYLANNSDYLFPIVSETEEYNREEFCAEFESLIFDGRLPSLLCFRNMLKKLAREERGCDNE